MRRGLTAAVLLAASAWATAATAQPSVWDVAKDPRRARAYQALVGVERMVMRAERSGFDVTMQRNFTRAALAMLELAGGDRLPDPRLGFLLGDLLVDSSVGRDREALEVLKKAVAQDPTSPMAARAWFDIAIASARQGNPGAERSAYDEALKTAWETDFRANVLMNRGESRMVLGDLKGAVADYKQAIRLSQRPELSSLAYYGLGIALERAGDLPSGLDAMRMARAVQIPGLGSTLDLPSVFFVPAFDIHYYKALSAMSAERDAKEPVRKAELLTEAIEHWKAYLAEAVPAKHRWVQNAKLHLAANEKKLEKLSAKLPKKPRSRRPR
ncbi:MAG: tetratricopeptide repeat protein [Myxococcales bacterium]|nr:tetratricopeptide repeat protein [Myxococcales bacterium]MCB9577153.1 tetratricopeptide repeat protein [Polyangiaceae bacterium]